MDRSWVNYWVDIGILISFLLAGVTGIIKWPALLPFFGIGYGQIPLSLITAIHDWSGLAMVILALIHVILHWKWIVCMSRRLWKGS